MSALWQSCYINIVQDLIAFSSILASFASNSKRSCNIIKKFSSLLRLCMSHFFEKEKIMNILQDPFKDEVTRSMLGRTRRDLVLCWYINWYIMLRNDMIVIFFDCLIYSKTEINDAIHSYSVKWSWRVQTKELQVVGHKLMSKKPLVCTFWRFRQIFGSCHILYTKPGDDTEAVGYNFWEIVQQFEFRVNFVIFMSLWTIIMGGQKPFTNINIVLLFYITNGTFNNQKIEFQKVVPKRQSFLNEFR